MFKLSFNFKDKILFFYYSGGYASTQCPGEIFLTNIPFTSSTFSNGYTIKVGGSGTNVMSGMTYYRLRISDDEDLAFRPAAFGFIETEVGIKF